MRTMGKNLKIAVIALAAIMMLSASPVSAAAKTVDAPRNLMLSLMGNSSEMAVTWWNDESETAGEVRYGTVDTLENCATAPAVRVYSSDGTSVFESTLTGLLPDTVYYYQAVNNGETSPVKSFKTPESNLQSYSFFYLGDVQLSETGAESIADSYASWGKLVKAAKQKNPDLAFGLQGGDLVENGIRMEEWDALLENASSVFSQIPFMPANGNHESNFPSGKPELYLNLFTLPENGPDGFKEEFYSFDYGSCHIAVLNSWVFSGEQKLTAADFAALKDWIAKDLTNSKATWKIVVTHVPAYALHSDVNADAVKKNWAPVFEQCGVDLVFIGHQHVYSRSFPMYQGKVDYEKGVTYIMGNSGPKFYSSADEKYSEKTIYNTSTYQVVHIDGDTMEVMTYDLKGNELDYWSALAKNRTAQQDSREDQKQAAAQESSEALTRAGFASMLYRMAEGTSPAGFGDAMSWASAKGFINGYGNGRFGAQYPITREQLAAVLYRYASAMDRDITARDDLSGFPDAAKASEWSFPAFRWAAGAGLIGGRTLDPAGTVTQAECDKILEKFESQ